VPQARHKLLFLPACSPKRNPIEGNWANMKRSLIDIIPDSEDAASAVCNYFDVDTF
jgi:transposase